LHARVVAKFSASHKGNCSITFRTGRTSFRTCFSLCLSVPLSLISQLYFKFLPFFFDSRFAHCFKQLLRILGSAFAEFGLPNKHSMAELIAKHIPALEHYLPPPRKPWMSEDARMGIFDAAALALVFFQRAGGSEGQIA
jgi:hypothetical protein